MDTDSEMDSFNPHEDAEPFLRDILRHAHGRLAPSLHCLVTMLRDTLSIVVVLEAIRQEAQKKGMILDVYPKAAGWYRLLYNDLKFVHDATNFRPFHFINTYLTDMAWISDS